jgi:biotin operon repressor
MVKQVPTPDELVKALHRFGLERDRLRSALTQLLGLPASDLDALEHLELAGALSQRDLADRLLLSSGSVTTLVDRLERSGLVIRTPHPTDRRVTMVRLAPHLPVSEPPEMDTYHRAVAQAAAALAPAARGHVVAFLTAAAKHADAGTAALRARRRSSGESRRR